MKYLLILIVLVGCEINPFELPKNKQNIYQDRFEKRQEIINKLNKIKLD